MKLWREGRNEEYWEALKQKEQEEFLEEIAALSQEDRDAIKKVAHSLGQRERWLESLREELKKAKEDAYKDKELAKMKTQYEEMEKDYYRGFPISEKEEKRIKKWTEEHEKIHPGGQGCGGGKYSYHFVPTGLGISGTIRCSCGAEFEFQEIG